MSCLKTGRQTGYGPWHNTTHTLCCAVTILSHGRQYVTSAEIQITIVFTPELHNCFHSSAVFQLFSDPRSRKYPDVRPWEYYSWILDGENLQTKYSIISEFWLEVQPCSLLGTWYRTLVGWSSKTLVWVLTGGADEGGLICWWSGGVVWAVMNLAGSVWLWQSLV